MIIYALFSALIWSAVTLISHGWLGTGGFFYDLPNGQMPFGRFFILYVLAFTIYLLSINKVSKLSEPRRSIFIVFAGAIIFRVILLPGIPIHENDIYRYIWDGKVFTSGINPYKYPPIQASVKPASGYTHEEFKKLKSIRDKDPKSYRRISFKDVSTIYPPFAQAVFALSTLVAPGSILFMKFMFVMFDTGIIFLLFMILKRLGQNPLYVIVYAWNPLVLKEFANSGHYDTLAIFAVMAAVYMLLKERYIFSSISLGLGVLAKFYPIIFIPFLLIKKQYKAFLVCFVIITAGYLPFLLWDHTGLAMFSGLGTYAQAWANSGFIFKLFHSSLSLFSIDSYLVSKLVCAGIFAVLWFYVCFGKRTVIEKMFIAVTSLFLLSPVGDPWYFCWVIPFLCIYRRFSLVALSFLLILHYFVFTRDLGILNIGGFKIDNLLLIQYVPFYLFLFIEWRFDYGIFNKTNHTKTVP